MEFYPHNVSTTLVGTSISASVVLSGSYINNFAAIPITFVSTASIALNISGARGPDGTSVAITGPKGATGPRGVTGFRGNNILLLSGAWHAGSPCSTPPSECYAVSLYTAYDLGGSYTCDFGETQYNPTVYYTTQAGTFGTGFPMYTNPICTTPAGQVTILGAYNIDNNIYGTNVSSTSSLVSACGTGA